ncbi:MAG: hypothetical protein HXX10_04785 [Rhodoplanes sp.]|uniref:serpin family protein n=1 Tax=Rhodoplanes sp. TaxID=1968906 RepID=UPI0017FD2E8A|nr:serpin family protein [Rhodoplanes sp.]NVO13333.1 hypothetical protein [Rhodoplanes sp.]
MSSSVLTAAAAAVLLTLLGPGFVVPSDAAPADRSDGRTTPARKPKAAERPPGVPVPAPRPQPVAAKPAPVAVDAAGMLAAQSRLAFRLVETLQKEKPDAANLVVSPGSLAMVMTLIDLGADATLKAALARTLAFGEEAAPAAPGAETKPAAKPGKEAKPRKGDKGRVDAAKPAPPPPAVDLATVRELVAALQSDKALAEVLSVANAIWVDPAAKTKEPTLAAVGAAGGEVFRESLSTPEALAKINGWVSEKTRGMIPTILERVPADPGLVALNALYFKDRWRTSFAVARTKPAPFTLQDGSKVEVPMMAATIEAVPVRSDDGFVAAELGYTHERFALVLLTSKDKPLRAAEFAPAAAWLSGEGFAPATVDLSLPRLKLEERTELLPVLDALGLKEGRMSPTALDGFAPGQRISDVIQKTVLKIDESGTEAAAATAVLTVRSAVRSQNQRIAFDKPFWFALRDRDTGVVLLAGFVGNPGRAVATAEAVAPAEAAPAAAAPAPMPAPSPAEDTPAPATTTTPPDTAPPVGEEPRSETPRGDEAR